VRRLRHNAPVATQTAGRPGRRPAATPDEVLDAALQRFLAGRRLEVLALAEELGVARATVYRWFGTRERLVGRVVVMATEPVLMQSRERAGGSGGEALLETLDRFNRSLARAPALRAFLEHEREEALGIICAADGTVTPAISQSIADLIQLEADAGAYVPPLEPVTLAQAVVKLGQAFLFNHGGATIRGDVAGLHDVQAALLRVPPRPA
jgi:AcrR family transcriptional regulator